VFIQIGNSEFHIDNVVDLAIDKIHILGYMTANCSRENELLMKEIPRANTQAVAIAGGPKFVKGIDELNMVGNNVSLETSDVSSGWKKRFGKWKKTKS